MEPLIQLQPLIPLISLVLPIPLVPLVPLIPLMMVTISVWLAGRVTFSAVMSAVPLAALPSSTVAGMVTV